MHERLTNPLFWAAHHSLLLVDEDRDSDALIESIFGLAADEVTDFYMSELVQPDGQPTPFDLPIADGHSIAVEVADCGEDGDEQRYFIKHESDGWTLLGYHSAHFALPAFRWQEVQVIASAARCNHGPASEAAAILLLLSGIHFTDAEDLDAVREIVSDAWRNLPYIEVRDPDLAAATSVTMLSGHELRWWRDPQRGWVNDGEYSLRNPQSVLGLDLGEERFARIEAFLTAIGIGDCRAT